MDQFISQYKKTLNSIKKSVYFKENASHDGFLVERFGIQLVILWLLNLIGVWDDDLIQNFRSDEDETNYYKEFILPKLRKLENTKLLFLPLEELELITAPNSIFYQNNVRLFSEDGIPIFNLLEAYGWHVDEKNRRKRAGILTPAVLSDIYEQTISRDTVGTVYTPASVTNFIVKTALKKYMESASFKAKKNVSEIFILDPAMGTGNFVISALFNLEELYINSEKKEATAKDLMHIRQRIISNQLYGIDLDKNAVKICIIRLFFALLSVQLQDGPVKVDDIKVVPNFFVNNALIMLNNDAWKKKKWDIILMNPPYVRAKEIPHEQKQIYKRFFKTAYGAYDISILFMELGLKTLTEDGILGCITSNKWLIADFGKELRKQIKDNYQIKELVDLTTISVFQEAQIDTIICFLQNKKPNDNVVVKKIAHRDELNENTTIKGIRIKPEKLFSQDDECRIHLFHEKIVYELLEQIEQSSIPLEKLANIRTGIMGFNYWLISKCVTEKRKNDHYIKLLTNSLIEPYNNLWGKKKIKIYGKTYTKLYLNKNCQRITNHTRTFFEKRKIAVRGISRKLSAVVVDEEIGLSVAVHGIIPKKELSDYSLVAILNSPVIDWYHKAKWYTAQIPQGSLRYPITFFKALPIKIPELDDQKAIERLSKILHKKKTEGAEELFKQAKELVDALIFVLYLNLNQDETIYELKKQMLIDIERLADKEDNNGIEKIIDLPVVKLFKAKVASNSSVKYIRNALNQFYHSNAKKRDSFLNN